MSDLTAQALASEWLLPAPADLREEVADSIESAQLVDPRDGTARKQVMLQAVAVIEGHIAPLLAERDALERKLEQYRSEMRGYEELAPRLAAERDEALAKIQQANILFSSLTPGGSDFQDWKRCVDYALDRHRRDMELIISTKKEANHLRDALAVIAAHNGDRWEYDDEGRATLRQPPPQEIARATLGLPEQAR